MITKSFTFVLLFHISNASNAGETHNSLTNFLELAKIFQINVLAGKTNNITAVELARIFEKSCLETDGLLLSKLRICIPEEDKFLIQYPPSMKLSDLSRDWCTPTNLTIEIKGVEVVEIDVGTLTISMVLQTTWKDPRPVLMTWTPYEEINLGMDEEKEIWSPRIGIWSKKMSENRQLKGFYLKKSSNSTTYGAEVFQSFDITTKVKFAMDLLNFPFDKHTFNLEVQFSFFSPQIRLLKRYLPLHLVEREKESNSC